MKEDDELPAGWCPARLSDLIRKPRPKVAPDPDSALPFVGMDHIEPGSFHLSGHASFAEMKSAGSYFRPGDVLYGRLRPYLNKVHRAKFEGVASAEFIVLPAADHFESDFVKFLLHQRRFVDFAMNKSSGDRPRVKFDGISDFEFALPPLAEQQRIVEKIETLFAELDKGEQALREVQKLLSRYRQSVLKAAVTGELTGNGSAGWTPAVLGDLLEDIRYGTAKKCRADVEGTAVLRIPNVVGGEIDLADLKFTSLAVKELEKLSLREGDILIVRSNGSANLVGHGAIVTPEAVGMAYAGYLIRLRLDHTRITPAFLHIVLSSPAVRARIERQAKSTSGVHNVNSAEVRAIAFDLPDLETQAAVVEAVEEALSRISRGEAWCAAELKRGAALRQSILKDAFSGKLVPQDLTDEAAEKLLERVRAERSQKSKPARKKTLA